MITRIILTNYMSHAHTVIEPAAGLTALIGPNNCGKSAIVDALEMVCYNRPAEYAVRHGEKEASVTVETDDGHIITWRRFRETVSYEIDGQPFHRPKRSVPDEVHRHLRMPLISAADGKDTFKVHFGLQKSPIFLLNDPPSRAATFFASSSDAEKLLAMQVAHRDKVQQKKKELTMLSEEVADAGARLAVLEPVEALSAEVERLEVQFVAAGALEATIDSAGRHTQAWKRVVRDRDHHQYSVQALEQTAKPPAMEDDSGLDRSIRRLRSAVRESARHQGHMTAIERLAEPPTLGDTEAMTATITGLARRLDRVAETVSRQNSLTQLNDVPRQHDLTILQRAIRLIRDLASKIADLSRQYDVLDRLTRAPEQINLEPLKQEIEALRDRTARLRQAQSRQSGLVRLLNPPSTADTAPLAAVISKRDELRKQADQRIAEIEILQAHLDEIKGEIAAWTHANPRCPKCGGLTSVETLLEGGHVHA